MGHADRLVVRKLTAGVVELVQDSVRCVFQVCQLKHRQHSVAVTVEALDLDLVRAQGVHILNAFVQLERVSEVKNLQAQAGR